MPLAFHQAFCLPSFCQLELSFLKHSIPKKTPWPTAATGVRPATRPKGAAPALVGGDNLSVSSLPPLRSCFILTIFSVPFCANPAAAGDSSGSSNEGSGSGWDLRYSDSDARRFLKERDETRHELEIISKQAGIADLEWQHERKQLLETIDGDSCNLLNLDLIFEKY